MRNIFPIAAICIMAIGCSPSRTTVSVQATEEGPVGYDVFYNDLSPYGRWIDYPQYGYVWMPSVEVGFRPYATNGHWVFTNYGWTWVSNYQWGWATFHYGRWMYEDGYGWMWLPGHEWAPAWVMWGRSGGYYGWAPLAPHISVGISAGWTPPARSWNFVQSGNITQTNINNYVINNYKTTNITEVNNIVKNVTVINNTNIQKTTNINNTNVYKTTNNNTGNYFTGPQREDVEKATNQRLTMTKIAASDKPGQSSVSKNQLTIFRPAVKENTSANKPAPAKFEAYQQARPVSVKNNETSEVNSSANNVNEENRNNKAVKNNLIRDNGLPAEKTKENVPFENGKDVVPAEKEKVLDQKTQSVPTGMQTMKPNQPNTDIKPMNNVPESKKTFKQQWDQPKRTEVNNDHPKQFRVQHSQKSVRPSRQIKPSKTFKKDKKS